MSVPSEQVAPTDNALLAVQCSLDSSDDPAQEAERELVAQWQKRIKAARDQDKFQRKQWRRWRRYAAGQPAEGEQEWLVDTNLIEATIEGLLPHLYAQDPDVAITPAEAANPQEYAQVRIFARTLQTVISRLLWDSRMKARAQRMIRSTMVTGVGWLKLSMQLDTVRDPLIERRISDLQDQLKRMALLHQEITDQTLAPQTTEAAQAELQHQLQALQEKVEVMVARGLVVDTVAAEDLQVDNELREIADYTYAKWIAQRIWYTPEAAQQEFGMEADDLKGATSFVKRVVDDSGATDATFTAQEVSAGTSKQTWLACWEIWDKGSGTCYTLIEGVKDWVRKPYPPKPSGTRFFPFFLLGFHWQPEMRYPQSDVEMWHKLQDEYSRTRSSFALHRRRAKPARVFDSRAMSMEDAKRVANPDTNELVPVDKQGSQGPITDFIGMIPYPPVDAGLYDTSMIRSDLEQVSGLSDAMRQAIARPKTATEASIAANSAASRLTVRQDAVEDVLEECVVYIAELVLQAFTPQDAVKYAGQGAIWPKLPLEQIHTLLDISIKAGTTGKPNQQLDQQIWTQVGPQIWQAITQIDAAMKAGDMGLANAYKNMLRITLERFDLKIEVNEIVPQQAPQPPPPRPPDARQDDVMIRNGSMTIDEARQARGLPPLPGGLGAVPLVYTKNGAVPLSVAMAGGLGIPAEVSPVQPWSQSAPAVVPAPALPMPQAPMPGVPGATPGPLPSPLPSGIAGLQQ